MKLHLFIIYALLCITTYYYALTVYSESPASQHKLELGIPQAQPIFANWDHFNYTRENGNVVPKWPRHLSSCIGVIVLHSIQVTH